MDPTTLEPINWPELFGGLGLFILGMMLLSEGLKAAASHKLHDLLRQFTQTMLRSQVAGFLTTALLQSSSATVLITIGLVNAGLMPFYQSIGVIYGANLGTTSTAWIVSTLGFKLNLTAIALPVIAIGAFVRISTKGFLANLGLAAAGFGLLFFGIHMLQSGMAGLAEQIDLVRFSDSGWITRFVLLFVGIVMTVIMQSSSAATAATLTALAANAISVEQAAVLVIGQNVGTTVKSALGSIGSNTAAKRTALAHIFFNLITGFVAFVSLPLFLWATGLVNQFIFEGTATDLIALSTFHTLFNLAGIAICLPFTQQIAENIQKLIPEKQDRLTRRLNQRHLTGSVIDLEPARLSLIDVTQELLRLEQGDSRQGLDEITEAIEQLYVYCSSLSLRAEDPKGKQLHAEILHALDHLGRFQRQMDQPSHFSQLSQTPTTKHILDREQALIHASLDWLRSSSASPVTQDWEEFLADLRHQSPELRAQLIDSAVQTPQKMAEIPALLDGLRRLEIVAKSMARLSHHLDQMDRLLNKDSSNSDM